MAAVARPPVAAGSSGLKAALIVFVCLTVASLGGFVYLFTLQSDLDRRATDQETAAAAAQRTANEANQHLSNFAKETIGQATNSAGDIQKALDEIRDPLVKDEQLKISADQDLKSAVRQLYTKYRETADELAKRTAERDKLNADFEALNKTAQESQKIYTDKLAQLQTQYEQLEKESKEARDAWAKDVADLKARLASATDTAGLHLNRERQMVQNLEQQLAQRDTRIQELRETLASFRPSADQFAAIQIADGTIVRLVPGQKLVYISLGARDRVKPGMNFAVYSRHRGIPADGKGKAALEVSQVFETTAEAKVLSTTPGDPIVEGDIIANPVFDRNRQFNFVVAGDFDLDYDGRIDDPGGQQVARMIENWGGKIVKTVDTRTDFVVLGAPPTGMTGDSGLGTGAHTVAEHKAEHEAATKQFEALKNEARALSIPVLTRTQFLHFIGRPVPANAQDNGST
ncbi:MAG: hypothetical protein WBL15_07895 [Phycisphaerae bacterium]|nr:hypothetical protein [Phycisphaerae bacterium]HOL28398.1 hypothetical protein [Phycisphaerae bacterium]HPP22836.1 hypothetical protein [Phycisphaerae bacterium]